MAIFKKAYTWILLALIFLGGFLIPVNNLTQSGSIANIFGVQSTYAQGGGGASGGGGGGGGATNSTSSSSTSGTSHTGNQSNQLNDGGGDQVREIMQKFVAILNAIAGVLTMMISPLVMLVGWLLSPDWTSGDIFNLREPMYKLWVTVSNIIYFVYAILLIVIAIATIFNSQNFGYKALLPKLFIGILMVPFSWFVIQQVIAASTIITASVLTIPQETIASLEKGQKDTWWTKKVIPKKIQAKHLWESVDAIGQDCAKNPGSCISPKEFTEKSGGVYSPIMIYAYGIFKIQDVKQIHTGVDVIKSVFDVVASGLIGVLMFFVFGLLTIALVCMLFMRAFKLWIYAIFSPLFTFKFVLKDIWKSDDTNISEFFGLAFLPAAIGLVLSFGLIIISSLNNQFALNSENIQGDCSQECTLLTIMGNPENKITQRFEDDPQNKDRKKSITTVHYGGVTMDFYGSVSSEGSRDVSGGNIDGFMGVLSSLIVQTIGLIVMWVAFMAATKVSKAAQAVARPFIQIGDSMKNLASDGVKYMPVPGFGNIQGVNTVLQQIKRNRDMNAQNAVAESAFGQAIGMPKVDVTTNNEINNTVKSLNFNTDIRSLPSDHFATTAAQIDSSTGNKKQETQQLIEEAMGKLTVDPNNNNEFDPNRWNQTLRKMGIDETGSYRDLYLLLKLDPNKEDDKNYNKALQRVKSLTETQTDKVRNAMKGVAS